MARSFWSSDEYAPAATVYNRHNRWSQRGVRQRMFERLAASGDVPGELILGGTHVAAHRSVNGAKKGGVGASGWRLARRAMRTGSDRLARNCLAGLALAAAATSWAV